MKKQILFFAVAALALASCSSENDVVQTQTPDAVEQTADEVAIGFDAYMNRSTTRAGKNGVIDNTELQKNKANGGGFGVFGYYTDGERYSGITKPNFFYNQLVTWDSDTWKYEPVKYWPNEFGSDAISDQVDRVTLFAYAPWVDVDPLTGIVKTDPSNNITGMTRNNVTGDPYIKYVATLDMDNSVDLCYGVAANDFTSSNSAVNKNDIKKGQPYIDVVKPGIDANSKIKFDFKHATAQLKVKVDAVVNTATQEGNKVESNYTRIWIRSVTFEGVTLKGSLNLNDHEWYDVNGSNKITSGSLTVFDGRKDGKEAMLAATNELPSSINPDLVQSVAYTLDDNKITAPAATGADAIPGVTEVERDLFKGTADGSVFVIPTGEKMKVTIVYDVETVDPNLAFYLSDGSTPGSTIENSISKTIETFGIISAGYCYTLNLHLGMRTVDFDAVVSAWQDMQADVDLPSNVQAFAAANPETESTVILPSGDTNYTYEFAITGLNVNEAVTATMAVTDWITSSSNNSANGAGIALQSISVNKNTSTKNRQVAGYARWKGNESLKTAAILFRQLGAPLGLAFDHWDTYKIYITASSPSGLSSDLTIDANHIKVWKNDVALTFTTDFTYSAGIVELVSDAAKGVTGDQYKIYIQSGDAPAETVTFSR